MSDILMGTDPKPHAVGLGAFAAAQTFDSSAGSSGYEALDRFGRISELVFTGPGSSGTLHSYGYTYDLFDNPLSQLVVQADWPGGSPPVSHSNQRSRLFEYDGLHRLVAAGMGELHTSGTPPQGG